MEELTNFQRIKLWYHNYSLIINPLVIILTSIIGGLVFASYVSSSAFIGIMSVFGIIIVAILGFKFIVFFTGPQRLEQKFNQFHGSTFLSSFYRIYFPVVIIAYVIQVIFQLALVPAEFGGLGILDFEEISPSFMIIYTVLSFLIAAGTMALVDYEMKKNNLHYSTKVGKSSFLKGMAYVFPLVGIYFGAVFIVNFTVEAIYGPGILIPASNTSFQPDYGVNRAAKFWDLSTENEHLFIFLTFFIVYIAMEVLLRGYILRQAEGYRLGPVAMVFAPAILQATAFTSGLTIFTDPIYYMVTIFDAMLLGIILGIVLWRTGNFGVVIFTALFTRLMDNRIEFQRVFLLMLPQPFGEYNPFDNQISLADTIGEYFIYIQIALVTISPFILIVSYDEVGNVIKQIYKGLKEQWFGLLALGVAFILIDLVFSIFVSYLGTFLGFIVSILVLGIFLRIFFRILPEPTEPPVLHSQTDMFDGELPMDLKRDIKFLESKTMWFDKPIRNGIIGGFAFLYFLFLSAAYRQYTGLDFIESVQYTTFLVILPTLIIGSSTYLISRAYKNGYFFAETWRSTLITFSLIVFVVNILIWTDTTSRVDFSWRIIPISIVFTLLIWNKPVENPVRDLALGFARDGRYATFRYLEQNHEILSENFDELIRLPSDNIKIGAYVMASKINLLNNEEIITSLRERKNLEKGEVIGMILAIGLDKYHPAEGVLLDILGDDDLDYKMASYWSLGKFGTERALRRMAKILEENPKKDLVPIAETAILNIDPNYPLAGIRDSIKISQ